MEKLSTLFDDEYEAFKCLNELQENCVVAGSAITYALSDILKKEDIGDVDLFLLRDQKFSSIRDIISKYFTIESYLIVDNEYFTNENADTMTSASVITLKINERINFQIIVTNFETVQEVLDSFDFDYISVGIHKNKIYGEEKACLSWNDKKVLWCNTTDIYTHRFTKTLKKRISLPLYKGNNNIHIKHRQITDLSDITLIPMKQREKSLPINFTKLEIVDIVKTGPLFFTKNNIPISKAIFVLSDGNNRFTTEEVVVNRNENFAQPRYNFPTSNLVWVKPYILYLEGDKGKINFFAKSDVDKEIADYVIPFDVSKFLDKELELTTEEILEYVKGKCVSTLGNRAAHSAWQVCQNHLNSGSSFSKAAHFAVGTYYYEKRKPLGYSYYPYTLDGNMIVPEGLPEVLSLSFLSNYIR